LLTRSIEIRIIAIARGKKWQGMPFPIADATSGDRWRIYRAPTASEGASMFRGRYEHTIDAKGRTSLPARYRDALAGMGERRIVLTNALDKCLNAYAMPKWMEFEDKIAKLPRFDPAVQQLKRIYVSGAVECEIDDSGRILVPPTLRDYAALNKDVVWAGSGDYAELWDQKTWQAKFEIGDDDRRAIASRLAELGL
jgi:MraZ protein